MNQLATALLTAALVAAACSGGSEPATSDPPPPPATTTPVTATEPTPPTTTPLDRGDVPAIFDVAVVELGGEPWKVALAATPEQRAQGLMSVTDLGGLDGMLFVFGADTAGGFWMKDTLLPLEIAFFTADGSLVDVLAMVPCGADPCPVYRPSGPYRYAVEAVPGRLGALSADDTLVVEG